MGYTTFKFSPGLNKDDSPLASEGGWIDGNGVRFSRGVPEVIGGWDFVTPDKFEGIVRGGHSWASLSGRRYIAFGTAAKLYAIVGGAIIDITPPHSEGVLNNPFTTASGSAVVTVNHPDHAFSDGMTVTFPLPVTIGGVTISGSYTVEVNDANSYAITVADNATSTVTSGGGYVDYTAPLPAGLVDGLGEPGGYGTGAYGEGGYGDTSEVDTIPRLWFLDNWGETLVALPSGGALYQWQPSFGNLELLSNGEFLTATGWTFGTGWSLSASGWMEGAAGVASDASIAIDVQPGYVYRAVLTVTTTAAGSIIVQSDAGALGGLSAPITGTGEYNRTFRAPAGMTGLVISKSDTWAGTVDHISIKLEAVAFRVDEAPTQNYAMFVDPHQLVVLLGTTPYGEAFNAMAVRWSDRQDITAWTPTTANLAGDDILANGARLISGLATRQQNMIWSDSALFTMQYTGDASRPFLFVLAGSSCGIIGGLARCATDGTVFWAGNGNFYQFSGGIPEPIPSTLRRDFFDNIAPHQGIKVVCGTLPGFSEVWFFYPDARDGKECSRYVIYRLDEGHWSAGEMARTTWIDPGIYEYPIAFGTDGNVYFQENGNTAAGGAISWFIESGYFDIADGENLAFLRRIIGDFQDLKGSADFTVFGRAWPTAADRVYGPFHHLAATNKLDMRVTARQLKLRISGESSPAFARIGALRLDLMPSGAKR